MQVMGKAKNHPLIFFKARNTTMKKTMSFLLLLICFFVLPVSVKAQVQKETVDTYVVKKGDTLYGIARRYGVSVGELAEMNHIQNKNRLRIGQILVVSKPSVVPVSKPKYIPPPAPVGAAPQVDEDLEEAEPILMEEEAISSPSSEMVVSTPVPVDNSENEKRRKFIGVGLAWWFAFLEADARISVPGILGTEIDLVNDVGVDDMVGIPVVSVWIQPLSWLKFQGEYMTAGVEGSHVIDEIIVFDGYVFDILDTVRGELDVDRFSGWVEINPFNGDWGYLGVAIGGEYIHLDGQLSDDLVGEVSATLDAGTATLGVQAGFNLTENLEAHARIRGMSFEISDVEADVFDIQAGISYTFWDVLELSADYRYLFLKVEEGDNSGEVKLQGPMLGGRLKF